MTQKKDRSRFSIKFRENDPAHERTICILESQGQRNIAPFLVNAVLHYVQCTETPDVSHILKENIMSVQAKKEIEDIVLRILQQQGIVKEELTGIIESGGHQETIIGMTDKKQSRDDQVLLENPIDDIKRKMIVKTLSSFRHES